MRHYYADSIDEPLVKVSTSDDNHSWLIICDTEAVHGFISREDILLSQRLQYPIHADISMILDYDSRPICSRCPIHNPGEWCLECEVPSAYHSYLKELESRGLMHAALSADRLRNAKHDAINICKKLYQDASTLSKYGISLEDL